MRNSATWLFGAALLTSGVFANVPSPDASWTWPFENPVRRASPVVSNPNWSSNPIDAFVLKKLDEQSLVPAGRSSRRVLARRLYLDVTGMPPTREQLRRFNDDSAPNAFEKLVDRLLADPRYAERWARHWLDVVRYGESDGLENDIIIGNVWRYRDWVIDAFDRDLPYDRFVTLQLAGGDEIHPTDAWYTPDIQGYVPAGFLRLAPWDLGNLQSYELRQGYLDEVTGATASVFLGLTLECARCHDHKYDKIPAKDYYRFQAFFQCNPSSVAAKHQFGGTGVRRCTLRQ